MICLVASIVLGSKLTKMKERIIYNSHPWRQVMKTDNYTHLYYQFEKIKQKNTL